MRSKFKVGDRVKVLPYEVIQRKKENGSRESYEGFYICRTDDPNDRNKTLLFNIRMQQFCGRIFTVYAIGRDNTYHILEPDDIIKADYDFVFSDSMLEAASEINLEKMKQHIQNAQKNNIFTEEVL